MNSNILRINDGARMHVYQVYRSSTNSKPVDIEPVPARLLEIDAVMQCVTDALERHSIKIILQTKGQCLINGTCFLHRNLSWPVEQWKMNDQLDIFFPHEFQSVAPIVSFTRSGKRQWLPITWSLEDFAIDAFAKRLLGPLKQANVFDVPTSTNLSNQKGEN